jgi:SWI/SNF-related matrix-associated actin-dependent regulator 1 of chromatin subfamily A
MSEWLQLKSFQTEGAEFLAARKDGFLLDEQGVGKTAAAIGACDRVNAQKILVLVPASARLNWIREFEKFSPMDRGAVAIMKQGGTLHPTGVSVVSYDLIVSDKALRDQMAACAWDAIILDEAQQLKNPRSKRTRFLYGRKCDNTGLTARAKYTWRLSGTLAPNNVSELWTHLHCVGAYSKDWNVFVAEFCTGFDGDFGFRITGAKNTERLKAILKPYVLRRRKDEVLPDLPPLTFERVALEPRPVDIPVLFPDWLQGRTLDEFKTYLEELNASMAATLAGKSDDAKAAAIAAMAASTSALRRYYGAAIVEAYVEQVRGELRRGDYDKLVVMAHHKCVLERLYAELREFNPLLLWGATKPERRDAMVVAFQTDPLRRVFIGNLVAAGTAITLHASHRLDMLEQDWVPGNNAQAIMRVHRQGQKRHTHIRFFSAARGVHSDIVDTCARKTAELAKVGLG